MDQEQQSGALAKLHHLYKMMIDGEVKDSAVARRTAEMLLSPAIAELESQLGEIEYALDQSDAPIRSNAGHWFTLAERISQFAQAQINSPAHQQPWGDQLTAQLVHDLRECVITYYATGQLRDRIASLVVALCEAIKTVQERQSLADEQSRANFEVYAKSRKYRIVRGQNDSYQYRETNVAWKAWQAAINSYGITGDGNGKRH